jgi:hypothetical protein
VSPLVLVYGILLSPFVLAIGIVLWGGGSLLRDVWRCRHPSPELREHIEAFHRSSLADEAQRWLRNQ